MRLTWRTAKSDFLAHMITSLPCQSTPSWISEVIANQTFGPAVMGALFYAANIHTAGAHLLSLINDIPDLAKINRKMDAARFQREPRRRWKSASICRASWPSGSGVALHLRIPLIAPSPSRPTGAGCSRWCQPDYQRGEITLGGRHGDGGGRAPAERRHEAITVTIPVLGMTPGTAGDGDGAPSARSAPSSDDDERAAIGSGLRRSSLT